MCGTAAFCKGLKTLHCTGKMCRGALRHRRHLWLWQQALNILEFAEEQNKGVKSVETRMVDNRCDKVRALGCGPFNSLAYPTLKDIYALKLPCSGSLFY